MAVLDAKTKLKAKIVNGTITYKNKDLYLQVIKKYAGKDVIVTVEENKNPISKDLFAFYFGIIIRQECMSSESFSGNFYTEMEIHDMFQYKLRRWVRVVTVNGKKTTEERADNVLQYDEKSFKEYLKDLKIYLETNFRIIVKDYDDYVINKMRLTR